MIEFWSIDDVARITACSVMRAADRQSSAALIMLLLLLLRLDASNASPLSRPYHLHTTGKAHLGTEYEMTEHMSNHN